MLRRLTAAQAAVRQARLAGGDVVQFAHHVLDPLAHEATGTVDRRYAVAAACGAVLIASQSSSTITDDGEADSYIGPGAVASAASAGQPLSPSPTLCLECLKAAAESGATTVMRG